MRRLTELRLNRGISQSELARLLGKGRSTITEYESGKIIPDANTVRMICEILDCSADWLLEVKRGA